MAARLARTPSLDERDAHWLAGFIDAEGSFGITRNNGGRNWRCSMRLAQRRDDAPLLWKLRHLTGVGTITGRPAYRTSRPQAIWTITSGLECLRLAEILEEFPMYGRKRLELNDWIQAVRTLESRGSQVEIGELAHRMRSRRAYVEPATWRPFPETDRPGFLWYFGGFFTGEGSFQLSPSSARAIVKLRRDDRPLLDAFARIGGLGRVYDIAAWKGASPSSAWVILSQRDLPDAIEVFDAAFLRGRKRREFHVWRVGAEEFIRARAEGRRRDGAVIAAATAGLREARVCVDRPFTLSSTDSDLRREAFTGVLRTWAAETAAPLTQPSYAAARRRHPHWPTHTTIALAFGSWGEALAAAGLLDRATVRARRTMETAAA